MGIVFGLLAALLWGSGDVLINRLTVATGTVRALVWTQILSLTFWVVYALASGFPAGAGASAWGLAALCGVFHVAGLTLTYRAFEIGTLSIVSPIASSFGLITTALALATGEKPGMIKIVGAVVLVLGIVAVTRASSSGGTATLKGVPEAIGSAIGFGVMFWMFDKATPQLGIAWPLVVLKIMATGSAVVAFLATRRTAPPPEPTRRAWVWLLAAGVALSDSLAWVTWIFGERLSYTSVVTSLASLFSVVTVVLAAVLLRERLNRPQWLGIGTVFVGILLVSV